MDGPLPGKALPRRLRLSRWVLLLSLGALLLVYTLNSLLLGASAPNVTVWLIQVLPLASFLPGLLKNAPRAYQWLCFVVLVYFMAAVLVAFRPGALVVGLLEIFLCVLLFGSAIVFVTGYKKIPTVP